MSLFDNKEEFLDTKEIESMNNCCEEENEETCSEVDSCSVEENHADNVPKDLFGNPINPSQKEVSSEVPKDLFGNPIQNKAAATVSKTPARADNKDKPIGKPMIVRLYGQNIIIDDINLTLEDIRQQLSKDFPELSKDRTEMVLDEKQGLIIPVIKAARKGSLGLRGAISYDQLLAAISTGGRDIKPVNDMSINGAKFEVRRNEIGLFIAPFNKSVGGSFFVPTLPKIPLDVLGPAVKLFYENAMEGLEAAAQIFWNREKKEYFCHIPKQVPQKYHVDIERSIEIEIQHLLVMDIHSHHGMAPRFSNIDDADELETRLYAVVGWIPDTPGISTRASCSGKFIPLNPRHLFKWEGRQFPFEVVE